LAHHLIDEYGPPRPSTILDNGPNTKKYITAEEDIAERRRWLRKHTARTPLGEPPELSDDAKSILITAEGLVLPIDPNALRLACGGLDDQRYQKALDELFVVEFMVIGGKIARQPKN